MEKRPCAYYETCGLNAQPGSDECILHSTSPNKDKEAFAEALEAHRQKKGDTFLKFNFPYLADFGGATFSQTAQFADATFSGGAHFGGATFSGGADFGGATFSQMAQFEGATFSQMAQFEGATFSQMAQFEGATFSGWVDFFLATFSERAHFGHATFSQMAQFAAATFSQMAQFGFATFSEEAHFGGATFSQTAHFGDATFSGWANFFGATFSEEAHFGDATFSQTAQFADATFSGGAHFGGATFSGGTWFTATAFLGDTDFGSSAFLGRTIFSGRKENEVTIRIFAGVDVDFTNIAIPPRPDAFIIRDADFRKCRLRGTDLRRIELTNVRWHEKRERFGVTRLAVYDEINAEETTASNDWGHIERVYRELKENHKDRGDHHRAGDFHYGEKEMQRRNPQTSPSHRLLLNLYWLLSGYGERYIRPLIWAIALMAGSMLAYLVMGIERSENGDQLSVRNFIDWIDAGFYSLQVMTLLKPTHLKPVCMFATWAKAFESLFGPLIIGLLALAVRQRLRR